MFSYGIGDFYVTVYPDREFTAQNIDLFWLEGVEVPLAGGDPMVMRSSFKGHYEADSASLFGFGRHSQTDNVFGRTP